MHANVKPRLQSNNLLRIEELTNKTWFTSFEQLDDPLTKALVLVALMLDRAIIEFKEADQFKKYLMTC